jgi:lipoyl(octanoyl) transferase
MENVDLWTCNLGTVEYRAAAALQEDIRARVGADELPEVLLLLEHPPVYTLGRRAEPADLPFGADFWRARGIDVVQTPRGGKLTYHGPGQLVGYPIMRVSDIPAYVRTMEQAIVAALAEEGIEARGRDHEGPQFTGVWVEDRKIASIGVHVSKGVTTHGFAINVDNDVEPFHQVTACGLPGVRMTSIALETGRVGGLPCFRKRMAYAFASAHGRRGADADRSVSATRVVAGLRRRGDLLRERGDAVECPVCGHCFRRFKPDWNRADAVCWRCGAHERHRAIALLWRERPELLGAATSLLHFAPEWCFRYTPLPTGLRYVTADLEAGKGDLRLDIRALDLPDDAFDAIVCSHVLEHVDRDADALAELRRVVAPGGWVLLMVPQDLARAETYEDPSITDPDARRAAFWQHDHVRLYGRDFADRVTAAGFDVETIAMTEALGAGATAHHGLIPGDLIHLCRPIPSIA